MIKSTGSLGNIKSLYDIIRDPKYMIIMNINIINDDLWDVDKKKILTELSKSFKIWAFVLDINVKDHPRPDT